MNEDIYFKELKVGDIRRRDDQVRQLWCGPQLNRADVSPNPEFWHDIDGATIGWKILPGDLFNAEFRRPLI